MLTSSLHLCTYYPHQDPVILALNPALAERYAYAKANNIAMNPNITLVICCSAKDADQSITSMFFYTLYQSIYRSQLALNATIDLSLIHI